MMTWQRLRGGGRETGVTACAEPRDELADLVADLFEQHHGAIFAYLYRLVDDREWAHDLAQETFVRVFRARGRLPQVGNRRAWVYRVATNVAFNALRRRRRFTWLSWRQSDGSFGGVENAETGLAPALTGPDPAAGSERRIAIEQALAELPLHYRAPLLLYSRYDLSVREVAEALDLSPGAVKTRLYRAREMFRQAFERGE